MPTRKNIAKQIEAWFGSHDDGEFCDYGRTTPYSVIGPLPQGHGVIYSSKPNVVSTAIEQLKPLSQWGVIGRYGLPGNDDAHWIVKLAGKKPLWFLGDLDPVDVLVFAYLRSIVRPRRIGYLGIGDRILSKLTARDLSRILIDLSPSESAALPLLDECSPDLEQVIGARSARILRDHKKIEMEGIANLQSAKFLSMLRRVSKS